MDESTYLTLHLQPEAEPTLSESEMASILELAKRPDSSDRLPTDDDWEATYDLASAVRQGWLVKAAKAAGSYQFTDGSLELRRDQIHKQCLQQASEWARRSCGSVRVKSPTEDEPVW